MSMTLPCALDAMRPRPYAGPRGREPAAAGGTLAWRTTAAAIAAPRHNRLTKGKLPSANNHPPRVAPPTAPTWLLTVKRLVAVAHDGPACSVSSAAVTGHDKSNKLATLNATPTVAQGERAVVKTRTAPSPPPRRPGRPGSPRVPRASPPR